MKLANVKGNVNASKGRENVRGRENVIVNERGIVSVKGRERIVKGRTAIVVVVLEAKKVNVWIKMNLSILVRRPDLRFRSDSLSFQILHRRHGHFLYLPKRSSANKRLLPFLPSTNIIVRVIMASNNLPNNRQGIRSCSNKPRLANPR